MGRNIVIDREAADVLRRATIDEGILRLPDVKLERKVYQDINKVLEAIGGKWDRKVRGHVFGDPSTLAARLSSALADGAVARPDAMGYFPTPRPLAQRLIELARVEQHHLVLEPSAGRGGIADLLDIPGDQVCLVEIQEPHAAALSSKGFSWVLVADFMTVDLPSFHRVVMNPPFERKQDIDHVTRAFSLLKPGGRLVSIMSASAVEQQDRKTVAFRALLTQRGSYERNPAGSFKESGTNVSTITVVLDAPAPASTREER